MRPTWPPHRPRGFCCPRAAGDLCEAFARQTSALAEDDRRLLLTHICAFAARLAARLRSEDEPAAIRRWSGIDLRAESPNPTNDVLHRIGKHCLTLMQRHRIDTNPLFCPGSTVGGACQGPGRMRAHRHDAGALRQFPAAAPYRAYLLRDPALRACRLAGWVDAASGSARRLYLPRPEALGRQLEDLFSLEPNALPLNALLRTVERGKLSLLGHTDLPEPVKPQNNVLR